MLAVNAQSTSNIRNLKLSILGLINKAKVSIATSGDV